MPRSVGVPERRPVSGAKVSPGGKLPLVTVKVKTSPLLPVAVKVSL
jgi:hypothetical protein